METKIGGIIMDLLKNLAEYMTGPEKITALNNNWMPIGNDPYTFVKNMKQDEKYDLLMDKLIVRETIVILMSAKKNRSSLRKMPSELFGLLYQMLI